MGKMRVLLVRPSNYDDEGKLRRFKQAYMPSITLAAIKALTPSDVEAFVVDEYVNRVPFEGDFDLVGITALTTQARRGYEIADRFRSGGSKVVMGGMHVSALPEEALQHSDAVVIGEAEGLWEEVLVDCRRGRLRPIYKLDSKPDLKKCPCPDFSGIDLRRYMRPPFTNKPLFPLHATRGCPHGCDFCSVTRFFGGKFRVKPVGQFIDEVKRYGATYYFFADDNIVGDSDYARELFKALKPLKVSWLGQFTTDIVKRPDLVRLASEAGCRSALLGVETLSQDALMEVGKGFNNVETYASLFQLLNRNRIRPFASVIFGFDGDDVNVFDRTVDFLVRSGVGKAYFNVLTPLPGTRLYKRMKEEGRITVSDWNAYDCAHVAFEPRGMTGQELQNGVWRAYRRFFAPRRILRRNLRYALPRPVVYSVMVFYDLKDWRTALAQKHPLNEGKGMGLDVDG